MKKELIKNRMMLFIIIFAIIIQFIHFIIIPEYTGSDESWQLQAAQRLVGGNGFTASMDDLSNLRVNNGDYDLSKNIYNYLTNWPPLNGLIMSAFLLVFSIPFTLGLSKFLFWLVGFYGWFKFINQQETEIPIKNLFLVMVAVSSISNFSTSMYAWAIFPYIVIALFEIVKDRATFKNVIIVALCTAVSVALRYQMLLYIPSLGLFYLLATKKISKTFFLTIFSTVPAGIIYMIILYFNRKYGIDLFTNIEPFSFNRLLTVPKAMFYLPAHIILGENIAYRSGSIKIIIATIVNIPFVYSLFFYNKKKKSPFIVNLLLSFGLITFIQLSTNGDYRGYNIVLLARYWMYISPLFLLFILRTIWFNLGQTIFFTKHLRKVEVTFVVLFMLFFFAKTYSFNKGSQKFYKNYDLYTEYLDSIIDNNLLKSDEVIIFTGMLDPNGLYRIFLQDNKYPTFRRLDILNNEKVYLSGDEKIILMVNDNIEWKEKLCSKWLPKLLDKKYDYSIYLLN